jgi:translation elongation factor EF-G
MCAIIFKGFHIFIRYAKVDVVASAPIVPFRETIVEPPKIDMAHEIVDNHNQVSILFNKIE